MKKRTTILQLAIERIATFARKHVNTLPLSAAFVFVLMNLCAVAQPYTSRLGRFQVDQKRGCAPFTINLTNILPGECIAGSTPCVMDYQSNGTQQNQLFTYIYTTPGTYKLTVIYQSIGADDIMVTVDQNIQPNFEIYSCASSKASIKVVDNNYEQYVIDFKNDATPDYILPFTSNILTPPYTYVPPGSYTAAVRGRHLNSADNCAAKTQPFTTLASLPTPKINTLISIDNTSLSLNFTTAINIQYRMEIATNNSSTFQLLQILYGVSTLTVPNLNLDGNYYCFRLAAFDPCNNASTYSNTVCSDKFTATAQSDVIQLAWSTGATASVVRYVITRNGNNNYVTTPSQSLNDTDIICNTDYCYQITTQYVGGSTSTSLQKCATSFSIKVPTAINNVTSLVTGTGVDLSWQQDPGFTTQNYSISRSTHGSSFNFFSTAAVAQYTDNSYTTEGEVCYQISYIDKCGNVSAPGSIMCPVRLAGTLDNNNVITLVWSAYTGWKNGVKNYRLEKYNLEGKLIKSFTLTDTTFVDDQADPANQLNRYLVRPQPVEIGVTASVSNLVEFIKNANFYYPTAFTPNGDALNPSFIVAGQYIVKMNMTIFDRWGAVVFTTEKNEPWDGHREGKPMPASTYIWKAEITDLAGRTFSKEGTVALIRN